MEFQNSIIVYTDGGSRGNPGDAAYGLVIYNEHKKILFSQGKPIGITTNNVAEYAAIVESFNWLVSHKDTALTSIKKIHFFMDSLLAVMQLTGKYKIKSPHLFQLYSTIKQKEHELGIVVGYTHVRREQNREADSLVNRALDTKGVVAF